MMIWNVASFAALLTMYFLNVKHDLKTKDFRGVLFDTLPILILLPIFGRMFGWW